MFLRFSPFLFTLLFGTNIVWASRLEQAPKEIENVGIDEHAGEKIPLDLEFKNTAGETTTLRALVKDKPILLTMNYSSCPMLCSVQLNGLIQGLNELKFSAGKEFDIITVGLDPKETPERATETKNNYLKQYTRASAQTGWHFLVGEEKNIQALAKSIGFRYTYMADTGEYAHAPAVFVVTKDGVLSRYLYGVVYEAKTLRLSLAEAAAGKIGSPLDKILLYCFHYDATKGRYAPVAQNIMKLGGLFTVMILGMVLGGYWLRERKSV